MQAIILAAGMGKRLKKLTADNTKCMVKVNGITLIERMLSQLSQLDLKRIIIVVGYEGDKLISFVNGLQCSIPIDFIENPIYYKTNNIYSLALASDRLLEDDTLLLESDIIFEDSVLKMLVDDPRPSLALVDKYESWMDGTVLLLNDDDTILSFIPGKKLHYSAVSEYYKTVNVYKFSKKFSSENYVPFLQAYQSALGCNEYYEQVLRIITMLDDCELKAKRLDGQLWYEIDDIQDLDIASSMFASDVDMRLQLMQNRYGGYWRYPYLLDFCYLVNPYYPPQRMVEEIQASFQNILTQYPSGMRVNSLLAARNFEVDIDHIIVGNGAAELIRSLMTVLGNLTFGIVRPTFEEYPNRMNPSKTIVFSSSGPDYRYGIEDLKSYFAEKKIEALLLINPDNPSGNYILRKDVLELAQWCSEHDIRLIVDESFVDFANEEHASLISEQILEAYPTLIIVKSISKSFGVPGLRLGILVSHDTLLIRSLKEDVPIWNINSFAEFYMQIEEKYRNDYQNSLELLKKSRSKLIQSLQSIKGLSVFPSDANYLMIQLPEGMSATSVTTDLFNMFNLLIKDLSEKVGPRHIRVAVRNDVDNQKLVDALTFVLSRRY